MTKKSEEKKSRESDVVEYLRERAREMDNGDTAYKNRKTVVSASRESLFLQQFQDAIKSVFDTKLANPKAAKLAKSKNKTERILNLIISDTHYGSALDPREVGHRYGSLEEARRTAAICRTVAQYKEHYRNETELYVHVLGDIIQGQLHDMRDGLPLAEQVASAIRILAQAMRFFSVQFPRGVTFFCTPGNHGRNKARHHDRAVNQRHDSIETMVFLALKEVAAFLPNVKVQIGYEPKYDFELFDNIGFATHGDSVISPGYPGKSINVGSLKTQINDINNARTVNGKEPYRLFIMGHVHIGTMTHLPGGAVVITNGCLIPPDAYANSIGIFETACGQWMWESVKGHMIGDARFIEVGFDTDKDSSLDSIIKPFTGY
jgi:hypothetical protein